MPTMKPLIKATVALTFILLALSCKDDDPTKTEILTGKRWHVAKMEQNDVDILQACERHDDYFIFIANNTFIDYAGQELCFDGEQDMFGDWSWKADETILTIQYLGDDPYDWEVLELTANDMRLKTYLPATQTTYIATFESSADDE
jgi:hypothetical protein